VIFKQDGHAEHPPITQASPSGLYRVFKIALHQLEEGQLGTEHRQPVGQGELAQHRKDKTKRTAASLFILAPFVYLSRKHINRHTCQLSFWVS
jgi:hypothetical protein